MGVAPSILWGRRRQSITVNGATRADADWLEIDYALLVLLDEWEQGLCICGKHRSTHDGMTPDDYAGAFLTCPALVALDAEQVKTAKRDGNKDVKPDLNRARGWFTDTYEAMQAMAQAALSKTEKTN